MIIETHKNGLGLNPLITAGASIIGKIIGSRTAKQTYPWRVRPVDGQGGTFEIVYGTNYKWYPVWTGPLEQIFDPGGFNVSGNTNRGKWRANTTNQTVTVQEYVNGQWYTVDQVTLQRLIDVFGYVPKLSKPAPAIPSDRFTTQVEPVQAMAEPARTGTAWLIGLAAGVVLWFATKNLKG